MSRMYIFRAGVILKNIESVDDGSIPGESMMYFLNFPDVFYI